MSKEEVLIIVAGITWSALMLFVIFNVVPLEPQKAHNMAAYEIQYQRCLEGPKATVEICHEVAKFKSLTCLGCE